VIETDEVLPQPVGHQRIGRKRHHLHVGRHADLARRANLERQRARRRNGNHRESD
jgi:hypothetical protein